MVIVFILTSPVFAGWKFVNAFSFWNTGLYYQNWSNVGTQMAAIRIKTQTGIEWWWGPDAAHLVLHSDPPPGFVEAIQSDDVNWFTATPGNKVWIKTVCTENLYDILAMSAWMNVNHYSQNNLSYYGIWDSQDSGMCVAELMNMTTACVVALGHLLLVIVGSMIAFLIIRKCLGWVKI